jgi:hypothetical protein
MNVHEKQLLRAFRDLPEEQKKSLIDFAEFLTSRVPQAAGAQEGNSTEPLPIERPAQEGVIKAVRRLMSTYPMLDRSKLLNDTSGFITQHVIHGKPAVEVIDELEMFFAKHYETYKAEQ